MNRTLHRLSAVGATVVVVFLAYAHSTLAFAPLPLPLPLPLSSSSSSPCHPHVKGCFFGNGVVFGGHAAADATTVTTATATTTMSTVKDRATLCRRGGDCHRTWSRSLRSSSLISLAATSSSSSSSSSSADPLPIPPPPPPQSMNDEEDNDDDDKNDEYRSFYSSFSPPSASSYSSSKNAGIGRWEEMHGNYLLRPPSDSGPRALIHFLGGALVGAAPDLSYRYVLERLASRGYLVVATPYNLSFDHLQTCDEVIAKFERIAPTLARRYGAVPVVGVGHSCGALLQLLITSLFPDTPRAANALLSYNNKPVKDAVPFFEEIFVPFFSAVAAGGTNDTWWYPSGTEAMYLAARLGRVAAKGELPPDDLIQDVSKFVTPKQLASLLPKGLSPDDASLPPQLREALTTAIDPVASALDAAGLLSLLSQATDVFEQIPLLIEEVADGARDFNPPPLSVQAAARRAYRARRTLLLQYEDDPLDESEDIELLLREAETVMRMKRPMISIDIQRRVLKGGHASPCLAPSLDLAERAENILGPDAARERLLYAEADATVEELAKWLDEGQL